MASPSPTSGLHSPLNEFLEHISSEVVTNLLNVRLQREVKVGDWDLGWWLPRPRPPLPMLLDLGLSQKTQAGSDGASRT